MAKNCFLHLRVSEEMLARMDEASKHGIYRLSRSQIIERGITLALDELEKIQSDAVKRRE